MKYRQFRILQAVSFISWHYPLKRQCCRKRKYFRFGAIFTVRRRYLHHKFMFCANSHKIRDLVFLLKCQRKRIWHVVTNIFCSHWWIIDIIAIIHTYSNKWWFTLPAFHDIFITFTKKNVDNMTNVTLLNLAAIFQAVIWPEICAITSYYGNLKCHPFLWNGHSRKWALLLVEMDQDYLASDAGVIHVGETSTGNKLIIVKNKCQNFVLSKTGNNVKIYTEIEFEKRCYVSQWWINRLILATSANLVICFWLKKCVWGPTWRIHGGSICGFLSLYEKLQKCFGDRPQPL